MSNDIIIGNMAVIGSGTLIVPGDETISIPVRYPPPPAPIATTQLIAKIVFHPALNPLLGLQLSTDKAANPPIITIHTNWSPTTAAGFPPTLIGTRDEDGRDIYLSLYVQPFGGSSIKPMRLVTYTLTVTQ